MAQLGKHTTLRGTPDQIRAALDARGRDWGSRLIADRCAAGDHRGCRPPAPCVAAPAPAPAPPELAPPAPGPRYRSKTEARYAARLDALVAAGEVARWLYEPLRLEIGPDAHYTPDFAVWRHGCAYPELHEVKGGFVREAARVRFRAAVRAWPCFRWFWATWQKSTWTVQEVS